MGMIGWCDMKRLNFICLLLLLLIVPNHVLAVNEVNVYLFYQDSCDICKQEKVYLEALKERYPNMRVYSYEVGDSSNAVSQRLQEEGLVDNAEAFNKYMVDNNYANFVLPGTVTIPEGAGYEEIAGILTDKTIHH